jgi:hypothetical protein
MIAQTVAPLGAWPVPQPLGKSVVDICVRRFGIVSPEVLTHQAESGLEQIERRLKGRGVRQGDGTHLIRLYLWRE